MSIWQTLGAAIFTGERGWAWRRRVTFVGCSVFLAGAIHAIWFEPDFPRATMVLTQCGISFLGTLGIYATLAVVDDNLKRETERKAATP